MAKTNCCAFLVLLVVCFAALGPVNADCPIPADPENGEVSVSFVDEETNLVPVNEVVFFKCNDDYVLRGSQRLTCFEDGYVAEPPLCYRETCPDPPEIRHGFFRTMRVKKKSNGYYRLNAKMKAICNKGYELVSKHSTLTCRRHNITELEWDGVVPACKKRVTCKDPGVSPNGSRIATGFYAGDRVGFECDEGFELVGEIIISCQKDGLWSHPRPRCKPPGTCPDPPIDPHRHIVRHGVGDYFQLGEEIQLECEDGFEFGLTGKDILACTEPEETSEEKEEAVDEENGTAEVVVEKTQSTEVPDILENDTKAVVKEIVWDEPFAVCQRIFCGRPKAPNNGKVKELLEHPTVEVFPYHYEVNYECEKGYMLIGASFSLCESGGWNPNPPLCKLVTCSAISAPENGYMNRQSRKVGAKVTFNCNTGYVMGGPSERICLENGKWDGDLTTCTEIKSYCPNPGNPENGIKYGTKYSYGSEVRFTCNKHYTLFGSDLRKCQKDRTWSGEEAICRGAFEFDRPDEVSFRMLTNLDTAMIKQSTEIYEYNTTRNRVARSLDASYSAGNLVIYFLFDSSGSIGKKNFNSSLNFAIALVERLGVSPDGVRVGAIVYNETVKTVFFPWDFQNTAKVLEKFKEIQYIGGGGTATADALNTVMNVHIPTSISKLKNPKSIIFLLTDGVFNMGGDPKEKATQLLRFGAEIFAIAVAGQKEMNLQSLYDVVGKDKQENVYQLNNYGTFGWMVEDVLNGSIDYSRCGVPIKEMEPDIPVWNGRIGSGGIDVTQHYWPWMVALYLNQEGGFKLKCGGSLIDREWILTAAHCLEGLQAKDVRVKLGLTDIRNETHLQHIDVKTIYRHPKWNISTYDADAALLHLSQAANYFQHVRPICLSPPNKEINEGESTLYRPGDSLSVVGFGHKHGSRGMSTILRQVAVELRAEKKCKDSLVTKDGKKRGHPVTENMICAGDGTGKNDTCQGDSGSPLMKRIETERGVYWVQLGIVSWGIHLKNDPCTAPGTYGFYTKVSTVVDWIRATRSKH